MPLRALRGLPLPRIAFGPCGPGGPPGRGGLAGRERKAAPPPGGLRLVAALGCRGGGKEKAASGGPPPQAGGGRGADRPAACSRAGCTTPTSTRRIHTNLPLGFVAAPAQPQIANSLVHRRASAPAVAGQRAACVPARLVHSGELESAHGRRKCPAGRSVSLLLSAVPAAVGMWCTGEIQPLIAQLAQGQGISGFRRGEAIAPYFLATSEGLRLHVAGGRLFFGFGGGTLIPETRNPGPWGRGRGACPITPEARPTYARGPAGSSWAALCRCPWCPDFDATCDIICHYCLSTI